MQSAIGPSNQTNIKPDEFILYFYPSPGLNWSCPAGLVLTSAIHKLLNRKYAIGHVSVQLKSFAHPELSFHTGMTQVDRHQGKKEVLWKGYGFGILFFDFQGRLESETDLAEGVTRFSAHQNLYSLTFKINATTSKRIHEFLVEFKKCGAFHHYGSPHRPRFKEGGGCGVFAAACLEIAGLLDSEYVQAWQRRVRVPQDLVGGPGVGRKVSLWKLLSRFHWATANEPAIDYSIWDPDLMVEWVKKKRAQELVSPSGKLVVEPEQNSIGLTVDVQNRPCPQESLFLGEPDFTRFIR